MKASQLPPLEETELVLEELFRHTPVGVVLSDLHGTILDVNDALCAMVGYTRAELIGRGLIEISHPDDLADILARTADLREGKRGSYVVNRRYVTRSGEIVHARVSASVVYAKSGEPVCGLGFIENNEAQERVARSEERHRRLFNALPVAVWENDWSEVMAEVARRDLASAEKFAAAVANDPSIYYDLGKLVRITAVNPAALAMAGVATPAEFEQWLGTAATRESAVRWSQSITSLMFGDSSFVMGEYTLVRAGGEPIDVLVRIARSDRWGEDFMTFPIAVDISESKRIERELVHRQELTTRAEAAAHFGSWEWSPDDDRIYGSPEFWRILEGRDTGGPYERPLHDVLALMDPRDAAEVEALWKKLQMPSAQPRPAVYERDYRLARADGSVTIVRGQNFATYGEDGALIRGFGIVRDITDARRAEEDAARQRDELERADKMITLGILVSGMAHEINNPNHTIGLNVPLLRGAWGEAGALLDEIAAQRELQIARMPWSEARGEVTAMLDDIEHASERIRNIVKELRAFALDQDPGERRSVSVNDVVDASMRLLGKHISRATRRFWLDLAEGVPPVHGNSQRLEQVVVNLVINACQALEHEDQAISIATGVAGSRAFIRVRDEGRGIAAEHLGRIRTPFFTTKRTQGGTGLGLAVSDRIAVEHGGELTFDSEPGRGTVATLWLPAGAS